MNSQINYKFPYQWSTDGLPGQPVVNLLMKAIIEDDIPEMYSLVEKGASVYQLDQVTLSRVLFHKITNFEIAKFFLDCGVRGYYSGMYSAFYNECYDGEGYCSGGMALAYYHKSMKVFELLAKNGFEKTFVCFGGRGSELLDLIIQRDDVEALRILLENGFNRSNIEWKISKYDGSRCGRFLLSNPVVHRKSASLEPLLIKGIPTPSLKTPKMFHKKENQEIMADYQDRVEARERFLKSLSESERNRLR